MDRDKHDGVMDESVKCSHHATHKLLTCLETIVNTGVIGHTLCSLMRILSNIPSRHVCAALATCPMEPLQHVTTGPIYLKTVLLVPYYTILKQSFYSLIHVLYLRHYKTVLRLY